jgi:hypothetical protein
MEECDEQSLGLGKRAFFTTVTFREFQSVEAQFFFVSCSLNCELFEQFFWSQLSTLFGSTQ